jgi:hypothetical protein
MSNSSKRVSELTTQDVADYLHLDELSPQDVSFIQTILDASRAFVYKYTGLSPLEVDKCLDITIAVYVLCEDMYDNRALYLDGSANVNKVVEAILGLHSVNLL